MSRFYVACDLGEETGRVMLGTLHHEKLTLSEVHRFSNLPVREKDAVLWDAAQIYQEVLVGLREIGGYNEPVDSISCSAWAADYLLFHSDASFIPPTYHYRADTSYERLIDGAAQPRRLFRPSPGRKQSNGQDQGKNPSCRD